MIAVVSVLEGSSCWEYMPIKDYEKVIFTGNYVAIGSPDDRIKRGLKKLIHLKELFPDKVEFLLGNNDHTLLLGDKYEEVKNMLNKLDLRVCYKKDNVVVTHAGMCRKWLKRFSRHAKHIKGNYVEKINQSYKLMPIYFNSHNSPIRASKESLLQDAISSVTQIIGKPTYNQITIKENLVFNHNLYFEYSEVSV